MVNAFRWMIFVIWLAVVIGSAMIASAGDFPLLSIASPSHGETINSNMITVSGTAAATGEHYIDSVTVNGFPAGRATWSADILLQEGPNRITVVATTDIGNTATETITVFYKAPTPTLVPTGKYSITLYVDPTAKTVYVNDTATYTLVVNKTGNINTLDLAVKGIGSLDKNSVTLDDDQVSLSITSTTIGTYVTTVTATSQDDRISASVSISTRVVTPASAETVQIDSNGSAIFRSEVIRNVIPKIQFFRGSFGYVTVNMLLNSTTLGFSIMDIEVPENLKYSPAIITFQVEKKWLEKRGVKKENIELYRKDYSGWVGLGAQWTVTEGDYEQYEAVTPGFSVFKIDIEDAIVLYSLQQSFADAIVIVSIFSIFAGAASIIVYWYVRRRRG